MDIAHIVLVRDAEHLIFASTFIIFLSLMKKILIGRITVITSPENSSEFPTKGKRTRQVRYKIAVRLLVLLFCPIERKKSSFPSGGTNPLYFSWNSPKGYTKEERGAEERRKAAPLVFFLVPATLKPAVLIFPLVFVLVRSNHYFIFFPPFFFIHIRLRSSFVLWSWFISCGPWSSGIFS